MSKQDDFSSLFAPEAAKAEGSDDVWKVLLVDDEPDIHAVLRLALQDVVIEGRPLQLLDAKSGEEAKAKLNEQPDIALILLDVVMETEHAGLDLVHYIRKELDNRTTQIVLVTGQPGYAPQREVIEEFEVDGYRLKSELSSDKIFVTVYAALRTHKVMLDLKKQRELLVESEARYFDLYDQSPDMYVSVDAESAKILQCNQTLSDALGYSKEEIIGHPIFEMYHPDCMEDVKSAFQSFVETGEVHEAELELMRKDGSKLDVSLNVSAVRDAQGKVLRSRSSWRDISDRKLVEKQLRKERDFAENLVNTAPSIVVVLDKQGIIERINPYMEEISGYTLAEVKGKDWFTTFLPESNREQTRAVFMDAIDDITMHGNIDTIITRAGEERAIEWYDKTIKDHEGNTLGLLAIGQDVTERNQISKQLAVKEREYSDLVHQLQVAVVVHDADTSIRIYNNSACTLLGLSPDQMEGKTAFDPAWHFFDEERVPLQPEEYPVNRAIASKAAVKDLLLGIQRSDVSENVWVLVQANPVLNQSDEVEQVVITFIDITDRKQLENVQSARLRLFNQAEKSSVSELLEATLNEAENLSGSSIGFFHFVDDDQETLWLQQWSTRTKTEFCKAEAFGGHYPVSEAGVWADALRSRKALIHNDYAALPDRKGMPEGHAKVNRELVVPVMRNNKVVAILGVGNKQRDYTKKDVELVEFMADLAWDIAESKRNEDELVEANRRFQGMAEASPLAIYLSTSGVEQVGEYVNPAFTKLFGYTLEEVPTVAEWWPLAYPDEAYRKQVASEWEEKVAKAVEEQSDIEPIETVVTCKDGSERIISWSFISTAQVDCSIGLDLTDIRKSNEVLQQSERRLSEAQRIAHLGNWSLDLVNNNLEWSDEIFSIFEIDPDKFGASYEAFVETIHPDDRERVNQAYTESLEKMLPYEITHRLLMKDGRIKYVKEKCETSYDKENNPLVSIGTVHDITDLMIAEEQLRDLNRNLEQKVVERTDALTAINKRLEGFNELLADREMRVVEVKQEVNRLCRELDRDPLYGETDKAITKEEEAMR